MQKSKSNDTGRALAVSIVLHHPHLALLTRTLDTLNQALQHGSGSIERSEVFMVDHSARRQPDDVLSDWQKLLGPRVKINYDYVGANPGFGAGHNRAFAHCDQSADYFLVANPDLEFAPDSIAAGIDFLVAHLAVGLLAPALIEADGSLRPACFRYPDVRTLLLRALGADAAHPRIAAYECRDWDPGVPQANPPGISGCCMLFRASAYARLGGFDPAYFLYFEDFDLSLRAGKLGLSAYCPGMRVQHFGAGVARKGWRHIAYFARSAARFFNTHGWRG